GPRPREPATRRRRRPWPMWPRSGPASACPRRSDRNADLRAVALGDDVDPGQVAGLDGGPAFEQQVLGMTPRPERDVWRQAPGADLEPLSGPGHRDELAFQRPLYLGQVDRELCAERLGDQADLAVHPSLLVHGTDGPAGILADQRRGLRGHGQA